MNSARLIQVRGVVQGVGFRPFVFRLAQANTLAGWVLNATEGVEIHLEGTESAMDAFVRDLRTQPPPATQITAIDISPIEPSGCRDFTIRESRGSGVPSVQISPDLPVCDACLAELFDPADRRYLYPYINCTNCGPRYSVILGLPYDRSRTTMDPWPLDRTCLSQYDDPGDRRYHAQPVACPSCGPHFSLRAAGALVALGDASISEAVKMLNGGAILAVKGLGGFHLACDARNGTAVGLLRERKYRKQKPFAVMARDLDAARGLAHLSPAAISLLQSAARPIVLAPSLIALEGIAPECQEIGVMLPYTPVHHLLFASGCPEALVMTSANRSNEPIAYQDNDALEMLEGIADAFLIGERRIARRVDDSVSRVGAFGTVILRRARGYAPGAVASLPAKHPILALGADLKNTITLVIRGQAFMSQHIGDLDQYQSRLAFEQTIHDLTSMYEVEWDELSIVHDQHPEYVSSVEATGLPATKKLPVQHHRAHLASVLAERGAWEERVLGLVYDGTGYGDDATIWGGEIFAGSLAQGFERVAHLRSTALPGGDSAARHPVQAAAGFLSQLEGLPDVEGPPFEFPARYEMACRLLRSDVRTFQSTSMGRLFDAAAALLGFTRKVTFEGQAAMWLEYLARQGAPVEAYAFPFDGAELDFRPLLMHVIADRLAGRDVREIARAFQLGVAQGSCHAIRILCESTGTHKVLLSGGVFQNDLLLGDVKTLLGRGHIDVWMNRVVPPNDGGISLGQAALACFGGF